MKRLQFLAEQDEKSSPLSGFTRRHWEEAFFQLFLPILDGASPGKARQVIEGPRSHHGRQADEMEGFTRSFIMAGPWLSRSEAGTFQWKGRSVDVAGFYSEGILNGTDPRHPEYWGDIVDHAQHLVECASLAWSLWQSREKIWERYSSAEQKQVADYLFQCTQVKYHNNNWLLFNVIVNSVLKRLGMPHVQSQIDTHLEVCDAMYMGRGWYRDGNLNRIDYYNAWAFHYYFLMWAVLDGKEKPEFSATVQQRFVEFAQDFRYFFAADGAAPCFGRSMIYRFAYLAPFALAQELGCIGVSAGEAKTMYNLGAKWFFDRDILTDSGHLSLGFVGPCQDILEHYSCGGSPYWAGKAFNILMLPENDSLWQAVEAPLPIHKGDFCRSVPEAGLTLIGDNKSGHVQLISQKSYHNDADYNAKYTKFAYSSEFSYEAGKVHGSYNCDNILQFSSDGIQYYQRWKMDLLYCDNGASISRYPLHIADPKGEGRTWIIPKGDQLILIHRLNSTVDMKLREGGYPLGFAMGDAAEVHRGRGSIAARHGERVSYFRALHGYVSGECRESQGQLHGQNVRYARSAVPEFVANCRAGETKVLVAQVCGRTRTTGIEELDALVSELRVDEESVSLLFADGEKVFVRLGEGGLPIQFEDRELDSATTLARWNGKGLTVSVKEEALCLTPQ